MSHIKNTSILSIFSFLLASQSWGLYLYDSSEEVQDEQPAVIGNIPAMEANVDVEELLKLYEATLAQLSKENEDWLKYSNVALYMAPRLLAWGAGVAFFIYVDGKNTESLTNLCAFVPFCYKTLSAAYYSLIKPAINREIRNPSDSLNTLKLAFSTMFHSPYIWLPIFGISWGLKHSPSLAAMLPHRGLLTIGGHLAQLISEALGESKDMTLEQLREKLIVDKIPLLIIHRGEDSATLTLHELVGTHLVFKMDTFDMPPQFEDPDCSICQSDLKGGTITDMLPCQHRFHGKCIKEWLEKHDTCPNCRTKINAVLEGPTVSHP